MVFIIMEFKKGNLFISEDKGEDTIFKKVLSKFKDIKNKAKSELEETKALVRILTHAVKSYSKNREFDLDRKDVEFIQGQSVDVIKNLLMITISLIPIPIPVTPFLIIFGKKVGVDILPKEHKIPEKGKSKKNKLEETIITEASKKDILINKVGLNEDNANYLVSTCGSLAVWMANKVIDLQLYNMQSWVGFDKDELTKEAAIDRINSGNIVYYGQIITEVMDWIRVGLNGNVSEYKDLSLRELKVEADEWHRSLGVSGGDINYKEKGEIVLDFRNGSDEGYYWVDKGTNDCTEESKRMGHCGRTNSSNTIWSLRSVKKLKDGFYTNTSHITASIGNEDGYIWQMKGQKNSKPKKEYHKYIIPLFYLIGGGGEEHDYLINGFGREYNSRNDFQIGDLELSEIKELYQNRPDLFNDYKTKRLLVDLGLADKSDIDVSFIVNIRPEDIGRYLKNDKKWGKNTTFYESILTDPWDFWNNYEYYEPEDLMSEVDDENLEKIIKILSNQNDEDLRGTPIDELLEYDNDNVGDAIRYSANRVDSDAYSDYLYSVLKRALETFGKVIVMNNEGVEIEVSMDIFDDIDSEYIQNYMEMCGEDPECVFIEAIYQGDLELPEPRFDENWYNHNFDTRDFNEALSDNLYEYL